MAEDEKDIVDQLLAKFGVTRGEGAEPEPVAKVGSLLVPGREGTLPEIQPKRERPERPDVLERIDDRLSELGEIIKSLKDVVSMIREVQEERMHVVIDPFKVAEFMGTGHGSFAWARLLIPKTGTPLNATLTVPDNEVWWLTFGIFGDAPSSSFTVKVTALNTRMVTKNEYEIVIPEVLYHEGWIGEPLCCPPDTTVVVRGGEVSIDRIRVGDEVLTGKGRFRPVSGVLSRYYDGPLVSIRPSLYAPIRLTPEHPVYVFRDSDFLWIPAAHVLPDDYVVSPRNALARVESVDTEWYKGWVFNLEVEDDNTYTAEGFVVHNCAEGWTRFDTSLTATVRNVTGDASYTDLPNQDIIVKYTAFLYVLNKKFADDLEVHIDTFFRRWARVTRPLARRYMVPGKDISVEEENV